MNNDRDSKWIVTAHTVKMMDLHDKKIDEINKTGNIETIVEYIDPGLASYYLEKNKNNRKISKSLVSTYACAILNGEWTLNHQGIAFYDNGELADGQHRLHAIIKSNKPVQMVVARGLKNGKDIDQHKKRTIPDAISISGLSEVVTKDVVSLYNVILRDLDPSKRTTISDVANFANRYIYSLMFIQSISFPKTRGLSSIVIQVAIFRAHVNHKKDIMLRKFVDIFKSGIFDNDEDIAPVVLRNHMLSNCHSKQYAYDRANMDRRSQYAIKMFLDRKPIKQIFTPKTNIYEINL